MLTRSKAFEALLGPEPERVAVQIEAVYAPFSGKFAHTIRLSPGQVRTFLRYLERNVDFGPSDRAGASYEERQLHEWLLAEMRRA